MSRYRFIDQHRRHVLVRELCAVLQVAPSSYYAWRQQRQQSAPAWERAVVRAFARHGRRYGTRRLRAEVQAEGHQVGRGRIRRVLAAHGLRAQQPRAFVPRTTDSGHGRRVAPNRLLGQPRPTAPDRVWVGDITCLPKQGGGWLYLASWQDACSRKVVGWDVRETMPEDLVSEALRRALAVRQPAGGLIGHSDQGSPYTAPRFGELLAKARGRAEHEPARQLLRQRAGRILLEPAQNRTARRRQLSRPGRGAPRTRPLHCVF